MAECSPIFTPFSLRSAERRLFAHLVCLLLPIYLFSILQLASAFPRAFPRLFPPRVATLLLLHYLSNGIFIGFLSLSALHSARSMHTRPVPVSIYFIYVRTCIYPGPGLGPEIWWKNAEGCPHSLLAVAQCA